MKYFASTTKWNSSKCSLVFLKTPKELLDDYPKEYSEKFLHELFIGVFWEVVPEKIFEGLQEENTEWIGEGILNNISELIFEETLKSTPWRILNRIPGII